PVIHCVSMNSCNISAPCSDCSKHISNNPNVNVSTWTEDWPAIAEALGMQAGPPEPHSLREEIPPREAEWAAIVRKYNLRAPTDLNAFVGGSFEFADAVFGYRADQLPPQMLVSTIKARQAGFHDCIDEAGWEDK